MNIDDLLGQAYQLDQRGGRRQAAVMLIRDAANMDPAIAAILRQKREQLRAVREARRLGERDGCHTTAVLVELLNRAL